MDNYFYEGQYQIFVAPMKFKIKFDQPSQKKMLTSEMGGLMSINISLVEEFQR